MDIYKFSKQQLLDAYRVLAKEDMTEEEKGKLSHCYQYGDRQNYKLILFRIIQCVLKDKYDYELTPIHEQDNINKTYNEKNAESDDNTSNDSCASNTSNASNTSDK